MPLVISSTQIYFNKIKKINVVLDGCETWSLILREECRLSLFENRNLRRISGPKRDENGKWRRLDSEELHSLYHSPNIVRVIKSRRLGWTYHVARMKEGRSALKILAGKLIGLVVSMSDY